MPCYDFRCTRCGATEEFLLEIDAVGPAEHEGCGGSLERIYAPTSIHFKGSGWAKLDRRAASGDSSSGSTSESAGGAAGGGTASVAGEKKLTSSGD